jgi:hypothetical protein
LRRIGESSRRNDEHRRRDRPKVPSLLDTEVTSMFTSSCRLKVFSARCETVFEAVWAEVVVGMAKSDNTTAMAAGLARP